MKGYYYNKPGFTGRDVLYKQLQVYYEKNDTPKEERISRRRMWNWLKKQSTNQLHRALPATSETIKPINPMYNLDRFIMVDLIIRGTVTKQPSKRALKYRVRNRCRDPQGLERAFDQHHQQGSRRGV